MRGGCGTILENCTGNGQLRMRWLIVEVGHRGGGGANRAWEGLGSGVSGCVGEVGL